MSSALHILGEIIVRRGTASVTGARALVAARGLQALGASDPEVDRIITHGHGPTGDARTLLRSIVAEEQRAADDANEVVRLASSALESLG